MLKASFSRQNVSGVFLIETVVPDLRRQRRPGTGVIKRPIIGKEHIV